MKKNLNKSNLKKKKEEFFIFTKFVIIFQANKVKKKIKNKYHNNDFLK